MISGGAPHQILQHPQLRHPKAGEPDIYGHQDRAPLHPRQQPKGERRQSHCQLTTRLWFFPCKFKDGFRDCWLVIPNIYRAATLIGLGIQLRTGKNMSNQSGRPIIIHGGPRKYNSRREYFVPVTIFHLSCSRSSVPKRQRKPGRELARFA